MHAAREAAAAARRAAVLRELDAPGRAPSANKGVAARGAPLAAAAAREGAAARVVAQRAREEAARCAAHPPPPPPVLTGHVSSFPPY
jgi:hypothetical protein